MRNIIFLALTFFATNCYSQKIKLKNNKILIDDVEVFTYKKNNNTGEFSIYEKNTNNELVFIYYNDNETRGYVQDDYIKINFLTLNKSMENDLAFWGEKLIKWFYENKLFDTEGKLDEKAIDTFIIKYNQNISNRTIRH